MSPVIKRKRENFTIPSKYLLFILTVFCIGMMVVTLTTNIFNTPFNMAAGYIIVPFQNGITTVGTWFSDKSDQLIEIKDLLNENQKLKDQVNQLTIDNTLLQQDKYELNNLRELYKLDAEYEEYEKIGARIISRDSSNWFSSFVIDKGSNDGVAIDMNIMAGSGLVGRVIDVGPNYAKVTSIIADNANTSGMILATGDNLIVSGDLASMKDGVIRFGQLVDSANKVAVGDKIVTSNISDKYLQGILIGYISNITTDANNLTKSGTLTPAVDFEHMEEVLVITKLKQQVNK